MSRAGRHRAGPGGQECHNVVSNESGDNTGTNSAHYQTTNTGVIADWPIKAENINGTDTLISTVLSLSKKRYLIFMDTFC